MALYASFSYRYSTVGKDTRSARTRYYKEINPANSTFPTSHLNAGEESCERKTLIFYNQHAVSHLLKIDNNTSFQKIKFLSRSSRTILE